MNHDFFAALGADRLISSVESFLSESGSYLPAELGIPSVVQLSILLTVATLGVGILLRIFFGKKNLFNQALSASVGILFVYVTTIAVYTLDPLQFSRFLSPLPFALFRREILILLPFVDTEYTVLCAQILSLVILCFVVHMLGTLLPKGRSFISWFVVRIISIVLAIFLNLTVNFAINLFLPEGLATYAPFALLVVLAVAIVIGLFNPLLCILFTVANPVIGLLYTFFFSNLIGKQITKAALSAGLLCVLFYIMEELGYTVINITATALIGYLPVCLILLLIWYVFDYKL